jgi:hypothetical protein
MANGHALLWTRIAHFKDYEVNMEGISYTGTMPLKEALEKITKEVCDLEYRIDLVNGLRDKQEVQLNTIHDIVNEKDRRIEDLEAALLQIKDFDRDDMSWEESFHEISKIISKLKIIPF